MIRVVIVEDELLVRLGMKSILEQSAESICVAGCFATAQEALDWFDAHTADILITDIRLPGMSGLELISVLGPQHASMRKMVLSCFENFDYAREAYELGVDKYILKHELQEDALPGLVCQLVKEGGSRFSGEESAFAAKEQEAGAAQVLAAVTLLRDDGLAPAEAVDMNMVAGLLTEAAGPKQVHHLGLPASDSRFLLLQYAPTLSETQLATAVEQYYNNARQLLANFTKHHLVMAVTPMFFKQEALAQNEALLKQMLPATFYCEDSCLLRELPCFSNECPEIDWPLGELLVSKTSREKFAVCLAQTFAQCRQTKVLPDAVRVKSAAFLHRLDSFLQKHRGCTLEDIAQTPGLPANYIGVQSIAGYRQLCGWLVQVVENAAASLDGKRQKQSRMALITAHLMENYQQNITLDSLAAAFFVSPAYLSSQFHKKTGKTFTKYLGEIRIQKAMELLEHSELSIEQVALESGFSNGNYFFRLFKKSTGQTAGEYRKTKRGNKSVNLSTI